MDDNFQKLLKFISNTCSYNENKIRLSTSLDHMGMYGDDKYDFLIAFSKAFNVDISNIKFELYVEPEPSGKDFILGLINWLSKLVIKNPSLVKEQYEVKIITVAMLLKSLEQGKWVDDN